MARVLIFIILMISQHGVDVIYFFKNEVTGMKNFFEKNFLSPWKKASSTDKVLWIVIPVACILSWLIFVMPYILADGITVMGFELVGGKTIGETYVKLSGYKEILMCLYMTILGVFSLFNYSRFARAIQAAASSVGLALFSYFSLLNDKILTDSGFTTKTQTGLVWPIVICTITLVLSCILLVNAKKDVKSDEDEVKED